MQVPGIDSKYWYLIVRKNCEKAQSANYDRIS